MSVNKAVHKLNIDLSRMNKAEQREKKAEAAQKKAVTAEKTALAGIKAQETQLIDQFMANPTTDPTQLAQLFSTAFSLGMKSVQTKDTFDKQIATDKKDAAKDKKEAAKEKKQALKDLKPAEYHLSLKDTNKDRKELGLKALKKPLRIDNNSKGLSKAVNIAMQAVHLEQSQHAYDYTQAAGARTNEGLGPTTKHGGRITFDCSGFVGSVYKAAGLPAPYTVGYGGTSFDVAGCKNMQKVSQGQAKPGDVVVFPD